MHARVIASDPYNSKIENLKCLYVCLRYSFTHTVNIHIHTYILHTYIHTSRMGGAKAVIDEVHSWSDIRRAELPVTVQMTTEYNCNEKSVM